MRRTAPVPPRVARKSEWLRSALAHHHHPDPGAENEIVVLATGIDQYLQEVFHHLAFPSQDDTVSAEDFAALCALVGLPGAPRVKDGGEDRENEEFGDVCSGLPDRMSFRDFHSRLCGCFRARSAPALGGACAWRLPVSEHTELLERQIRLRWPRVRRRKSVSFDLGREQTGTTSRTGKTGTEAELRAQDEVAALRELVEDLRSALQGSDARCLALEVALRREKSRTSTAPCSHSTSVSATVSCSELTQSPREQPDRLMWQPAGAKEERTRKEHGRWDIRDPILRELKLIRSSRDGQLEEAIKFNEQLEDELQWAYQEVRRLQGVESSLRKDNSHMRRRVEEAREALSSGLQRVRFIEEQAQSVPQLQSKITKLEMELLRYRIGCTCLYETQLSRPDNSCDADGLQRAVEGRAASDEDEDDRALKKRATCCGLSHSGVGCQKTTVPRPLSQNHPGNKKHSRERRGWMGPKQEDRHSCGDVRSKKRPDEEAEKTRLSLLEDKLTDSLTLLLQLRNKNVSRKVLEKIVMESLGVCGKGEAGPPAGMEAADTLYIRPASSDREEEDKGEGQGGEKDLLLPLGGQTNVNCQLICG